MNFLESNIKEVWKFFVSVKLTIFLLLSIAGTSIVGTLIPQNASPEDYVRAFGEFKYRIFEVFDIYDMYHSWWFYLLIIMLTINIIVCSIDRLSATWKIIFNKNPSFKASQFRELANREKFIEKRSFDQLLKIYEPIVRKTFGYTRMEETSTGFCIFAEKFRWTRFGVYIVHLSVVLLLLGSLIGSIFGFDGYVNIPEGESVDQVRINNADKTYPLGFQIRCDDFDVSFYDTGAPKEYRSRLTIVENGKSVLEKDIIVNDPLRYKGVNIFQSSYGPLPAKEVTVKFTVTESNVAYEKKVMIGQPVDLPEGLGTFLLKEYQPSANLGGTDLGEAFVGILNTEPGKSQEIILPIQFPNFDKMRKDRIFISVEKHQEKYYTGLQVTGDPGVWVVYAGFILMIAGCIITFFMSHQRICVEVARKGQASTVTVAGKANKNTFGMQQTITKITRQLTESGDQPG
ncbi:MAG: cytochrome c biogenesis protein ResB [Desulfobacterium sp.]|nr:cytochrome c biogenesis protein ResB [Desulfobacterium sp.]